MLIDVFSVHTHTWPKFQLDLEFKNGERGRFDMRPLLHVGMPRIATMALQSKSRCFHASRTVRFREDLCPIRSVGKLFAETRLHPSRLAQ